MHGTYFQARRSGLNDPAATQFPHFPNLIPNWCKYKEAASSTPDGPEKKRRSQPRLVDIPLLFPSLVVEKKVTADKRPGSDGALPYKYSQTPGGVQNRCERHKATLTH